jgi:phosphopantetheinyl transferase
MVFQMIPELKEASENDGLTNPRFLSLHVWGLRVLCGSLRTNTAISRQVREQVNLHLASTLWCRHHSRAEDSRIGHSFELRRNRFGKPTLIVDDCEELSISFTHVRGMSWAALCEGALIGIDAAEFHEFERPYPFHRAFHDDDRLDALKGSVGTTEGAAALIWSAKEAAVKAAGMGFHLVDPLQVRVRTIFSDGHRASSEVSLELNVRIRSWDGPNVIPVRSLRYRDGWISVALTSLPPQKRGGAPFAKLCSGAGEGVLNCAFF